MDLGIGEFIILYAMTSQEDQEDDMLLYLYLEHLRKMKREEEMENARRRNMEMIKRKRKLIEENKRKIECLIKANKKRKMGLVAQAAADVNAIAQQVFHDSDVEPDSTTSDSSLRLLSLNAVPVYYENQEISSPSTSGSQNTSNISECSNETV